MNVETLTKQVEALRAGERQSAGARYAELVIALGKGAPTPGAGQVSALLAEVGVEPTQLAKDVERCSELLEAVAAVRELPQMYLEGARKLRARLVSMARWEAAKAELEKDAKEAQAAWSASFFQAQNARESLKTASGPRSSSSGAAGFEVRRTIEKELGDLDALLQRIARGEAAAELGPTVRYLERLEGFELSVSDALPPEGVKQLQAEAQEATRLFDEEVDRLARLEHIEWGDAPVAAPRRREGFMAGHHQEVPQPPMVIPAPGGR